MSTTSKLVLGSACIFSAGIIGYVHFKQKVDRDKLHEGVIKDIERQQKRKTENLYLLQQQIELSKQLKNANEMTET